MNKSLLIPKIIELDDKPLEEAVTIMEERGVRCSIDCINWPAEFPYKPLTVVNAAHSGDALYLDFFVRCNYLRAVNYENNTPVWEDSSVTFLIQSNTDLSVTLFHFNCIGAVAARRETAGGAAADMTDDEIATIARFTSCGPSPFREVEGLFTWNVAVRIPFALAGIDYSHAPVILHGNFGKLASGTSQPHFLTWNPVATPSPTVNHVPSFGDIIIE